MLSAASSPGPELQGLCFVNEQLMDGSGGQADCKCHFLTQEGLLRPTPLAPLPNQAGFFLPSSSVKEDLGLASALTAAGGRSEVGDKTVPLSPGMGGLWELPAIQGQLEKSRISICRVDPGFLTTLRLLWSSLFGGSPWPLVLNWIWSLTVLWVHFKSRFPQ